jgi:hypothetical protein
MLESRALRSGLAVATDVPVTGGTDNISIEVPAAVVNQQQGSFSVSLTLQAPARSGRTFFSVDTTLASSLTVDFHASLASPTSSAVFQSVDESVTFLAGVSTETVTVPIVSSAPAANPSTIELSATTPSGSVRASTYDLSLYTSQDAYPPEVTSDRLITQGGRATGVSLTFDKPMAPATVEDPANYLVTSRPNLSVHYGLLSRLALALPSTHVSVQSFPLRQGTYDPSTYTVTLPLRRPVKSSIPNAITPKAKAGSGITDAEGHPLDESLGPHGQFKIDLQPLPGATSNRPNFVPAPGVA